MVERGGEGEREIQRALVSLLLLIKTLNPIWRPHTHDSWKFNYPPRAHLQIQSPWSLGFQHEFGKDINISPWP